MERPGPTYLVVFASPAQTQDEQVLLARFAARFPTIAADAGYARCREAGVQPVLTVGDFDSLGFEPEDVDVRRYPSRKDASDGQLALAAAAECSAQGIIAFGALGGRFDHEHANIMLLAHEAERGRRVVAIGRDFLLFFLAGPAELRLPARTEGTVSVFSLAAESHGVSVDSLEYELHGATLSSRTSLGLSNEFTGAAARISVREGSLLVAAACGCVDECQEAIDAFLSPGVA